MSAFSAIVLFLPFWDDLALMCGFYLRMDRVIRLKRCIVTMACENCTYLVGAALALFVAAGGERSPSWLTALRCTSVEHLPARSHSLQSRPYMAANACSRTSGPAPGL
jgi:hypothetical protein